ncbi:MAG: MIP/aquaporin family protein [Pseudomonadota bacterium]
MTEYTRAQKLAAEFIGTAFLLATVIGSGIMAEELSGGNVALALLGNTIPTGAILVVLITMLGPISGAHFNPVVTLVVVCQKKMPDALSWGYVAAQVAGGLIGAWAAHAMFGEAIFQVSNKPRTGLSQWFAEIVATFGLVFTILVTVKVREGAVATAVGLYITAAYWFTASTSFANPAVTIARGFSDTFAGISIGDVPAFIISQYIGGFAAMIFCVWFIDLMLGKRALEAQASEAEALKAQEREQAAGE